MRVQVKSSASIASFRPGERDSLTPGREYFVLGVGEDSYRVVNDGGEPILYPKGVFDVRDTRLPPGWCFDEYDEGEYHLDPARTAMPGFYEDYFGSDGDRQAELDAHQVVREMLQEAYEWGQDADRSIIAGDKQRLAENQERRLTRSRRRSR